METFSALLALCAGNSPVTGEFPSQRPVTRSFDVFFDLCLNKRLSKQLWVNLRRNFAHNDVTVMTRFSLHRGEVSNTLISTSCNPSGHRFSACFSDNLQTNEIRAHLYHSLGNTTLTRDPCHIRFMAPNLLKIHVALTGNMTIRSGHKFAHATTAELSWHVQNCDLVGSLDSKFVQK